MLILLISTWKSHFCDNDPIYDVIMQEPVKKWRHNHRHKISRDSFSELPLFKIFPIIFIFRQIYRANFAVRGLSSLFSYCFLCGEIGMLLLSVMLCYLLSYNVSNLILSCWQGLCLRGWTGGQKKCSSSSVTEQRSWVSLCWYYTQSCQMWSV